VRISGSFLWILAIVALSLQSCRLYRSNIMFKAKGNEPLAAITKEAYIAERNYRIKPFDKLYISIFTNKGERLIDPNPELSGRQSQNSNYNNGGQNGNITYSVLADGRVKIPMVGMVKIDSLTLNEAEAYLAAKFSEFYKDPYVQIKYANKRVIVLGSPGGQIIPLENENMSLIEVIALAGGIDQGGKAYNIRLIRGDLTNPEVRLIDLSTIEGMKSSIVSVESGDIVYIEPTRKIVTESLRDITYVMSFLANILTAILVIKNL